MFEMFQLFIYNRIVTFAVLVKGLITLSDTEMWSGIAYEFCWSANLFDFCLRKKINVFIFDIHKSCEVFVSRTEWMNS